MTSPSRGVAFVLATLASMLTLTLCLAEGEQPLDLSLVEEARRGLMQLDMSLRPKRGSQEADIAFPLLSPRELEVVVQGKPVELRYVDRLCRSDTAEGSPRRSADTATSQSRESALTSHATYVFYLEHTLLTQAGQNHALEMVEALVPALVRGGDRGIIVSSGQRLVSSGMVSDASELVQFLARVRKEPAQWAEYAWAETELDRMVDVVDGGPDAQREDRARFYARQDVQLTRNRLLRLAGTLGALASDDPPKVVLYFADTMRRNAGQQYQDIIGPAAGAVFDASEAFDRAVESAAALGVRLYTVHPEGLTSPGDKEARIERKIGASVVWRRIRYARDTLSTMALETGGMMFGGAGASLKRIRERLDSDLNCMYLLSFEPGDLPLDVALPVRVKFAGASTAVSQRYEPATRSQLVVASEGRRLEAEMLAAHLSSRESDAVPARAGVIPLGFQDGHFRGLVQLAVANPDLPEPAMRAVGWDLGLSAIVKDAVTRQVSGRIAVAQPRAVVVLEAEWSFGPGTTEIVGVASELGVGSVAKVTVEVQWPNPDRAPVSLTPIAIVQQVTGGFLRKAEDGSETTRSLGTLVGGSDVQAHQTTELLSLVCVGKRWSARELWVRRRLVGPSSGEFEPIHWLPGKEERCVQVHDSIPASGVLPGGYRYEVSAHGSDEPTADALAEQSIEFSATGPASQAAGASR